MNNIGKLVKQYNRFVEDLGNLNSAICDLLTNEFKLKFAKEYWSPRDRSAWSSKEYYCGWYITDKIVLYVCFNLITDIPYLQFFKCNVNLKESKPEDFGLGDGFDHIENEEIEKTKVSDYFMTFEQNWGKCYYCRIDLTSIDSDETVNTDLKKVIKCFIENKYTKKEFEKLKFL
jgi:hypothetical protein